MIQINGRTYNVPSPGGMRSFALLQRIIPVAGRVGGAFLKLMGKAPDDLSQVARADVFTLLPGALPELGEIFSQMPPGELEAIARTLLGDPKTGAAPGEVATCDKVPLFGSQGGDAFDALMRGRAAETFKLLWHAVEVWYPDFFTAARGLLARGETGSASEGSSTSPPAGPATA